MGRIKTQQIKAITHNLMDNFGDKFTKDFQENKQLVMQYAEVHSTKLRNIIAGYITRLKKSSS